MRKDRNFRLLVGLIAALGIAASATGLFYSTGGERRDFTNQYGDRVALDGSGLYAGDSAFVSPIFRGTDCAILFVAIPLLILALIGDARRSSLRSRALIASLIAVFAYYSASLAFGVSYNSLHLVYIAFFSASLFGLMLAMSRIDPSQLAAAIRAPLPYRGLYAFLALTGVALFVAWLPDIVGALLKGRPLALIEVYTTSVTNVMDIGIISPTAFVALALLRKREGMGYLLTAMLLTLCCVIGVMLPLQTLFQASAGIELPIAALIGKMGIFVALAAFALYFDLKLFMSIS